MRKFLKSKKTVFIIMFMFIIITLFISNIIAINLNGLINGIKGSKNVEIDDTIQFENNRDNKLFADNNNVYCIEHIESVETKNPTYTVKKKVDVVNDPELAYILNMPDIHDEHIKHDVKQNLIWWYIYKNRANIETNEYIKEMLDLNNNNNLDFNVALPEMEDNYLAKANDLFPKSIRESLLSQYESAKNDVQLYVDNVNNFNNNINITDIQIKGEYVTFKVSGTYDSFNIYINNDKSQALANVEKEENLNTTSTNIEIENNKIKIPFDKFTSDQAVVEVEAKMTVCKPSFYILHKDSENQRLMCVVPGTEVKTKNVTATTNIPTKVSLQKYITYVNGISIGTSQTDLINRRNQWTVEGESNGRVSEKIYVKNKQDVKAGSSYKGSNPVQIEVGDTVTYKIEVYNNSDVAATNVEIRDWMAYYNENGQVHSYTELVGVKRYNNLGVEDNITNNAGQIININNNAGNIETGKWNKITDEQAGTTKNTYQYIIDTIPAGKKVVFEVNLKYIKYTNNILSNNAWIQSSAHSSHNDNPEGESYRTVDRDYVQMEEYKVSLEKFVSKVNNTTISGRENHRYNENLTGADGSTNKDAYKKTVNNQNPGSGPVPVEVGDIVTFTIKLKNESTTTKVRISKIYDAFSYNETNKLELYGNNGNITGNGANQSNNTTISRYPYDNSEEGQRIEEQFERYSITFNNPVLLNPGECEYVTIQFKVTGSSSTQIKYKNKASIVQIKNNNGYVVTDSDGTDNNVDQDWVITKTYSVSLEKFVTKVTDGNGNVAFVDGRENHPIYNENGFSKENNKVKVEVGDKVTYTIKLTNTGEANIKVTKIIDTFDGNNNANLTYVKGSITGYGTPSVDESTNGSLTITIENPEEIVPGESKYFTLKFKVEASIANTATNQILKNTAEVKQITDENGREVIDSDGDTNNKDSDWVITKIYSVSLEKFVTKVTDASEGNQVTYNNRAGYRRNTNLSTLESSDSRLVSSDADVDKITYSPYKTENKVLVEPGDKVTFTIRLKNTGENPVKVTQIYDVFTDGNNKLEYDSNYGIKTKIGDKYEEIGTIENNNYKGPSGNWDISNRTCYLIKLNEKNNRLLQPEEFIDITIRFNVNVSMNQTNYDNIIPYNKAGIIELQNSNKYIVSDSDGSDNNVDQDYLKLKTYAVSLEKYVSSVKDTEGNIEEYDYREGKAQHQYDNNANTDSNEKFNNPVTVSNGDEVTYTIKLTNDGDTKVKITNVADYFPNGVKYNTTEYKDGKYCTNFEHKESEPDNGQTEHKIEFTTPIELQPGESNSFKITVTVIEPNISNNLLKNVAEIVSMQNRNEVTVIDSTPGNNKDADYIQLDYTPPPPDDPPPPPDDPPPPETTQFTVIKNWVDNNNAGIPTTIKVRLYKVTGDRLTAVGDVVTLNNSNWSYTWTNLDKYDSDNKLIKYTARELRDDNSIVADGEMYNNKYRATYSPEQSNQITITNKNITPPPDDPPPPETTQFTVIKNWVDNNNAGIPTTIKVRLYKVTGDRLTAVGDVVTLNNSNWSYTWTNLDKYDSDNKLIEYTARELRDDNSIVENGAMYNDAYRATYLSQQLNHITITNTYSQGKIDYIVEKRWDLPEGVSTRPASVTVKLFKIVSGNEIDLGMPSQELSDVNNWSYTWKELPRGNYIAREISESGEIVRDATKYNEYTETIYNNVVGTTTITNIYTPPGDPPPDDPPPQSPEPTEFTVEKVWDDNNNQNRPTEIKVRLYKITDDRLTAVGDVVTLDNSNWSYTWTNLDKYDSDNKLIKYTARELKDGILWTTVVVEEGQDYNESYKAYYLHEQNKTTITNKKEDSQEDDNNDLAIAGIVWNDLALDKTQNNYNGLKDEQESVLSGVKVMLYRVEAEKVVATTYTDSNGKYSFTNESLSGNSSLGAHEKFIKGPKDEGTNRWAGTYYSYYVIFEYNGVTYTSTTIYNNFASSNSLESNAREKLNNEQYEGIVDKSRTEFNSNFSTIKNDGAYNSDGEKTTNIGYTTINESGYIPQSINKYNSDTMDIQSSTEKIGLRRDATLEEALKHVNLGLRGRDIFDLELTSDVYSTKVTVNGVDGQYNYNDNKVTVRRIDTNNYNYSEDTANPHLDVSEYECEEYEQKVRVSDVKNEIYGNTGLKIEVTYKITVTNASNTAGTATKITNYYDSRYNFKEARDTNNNVLNNAEGTSGTGYKSVIVTTPGTELGQNWQMEIYVVYELKDAAGTLQDIAEGEKLATFNMAEITEYKTFATTYEGGANNEATRGLIDKDSAPGSAVTEKVRLHPDLIDEGNTTVSYYFGGNDLSVLKYEDDTYATPTLYFVIPDNDNNIRTITGTVFRDETIVDSTTKIKTGNGKLDTGEVPVYGATVQLIEQVDGKPVRFETTTNTEGNFEFKGFLPGNYIIRYHYGDTENTILKVKDGVEINKYSFNGEDYQSTNNKYPLNGEDGKLLTDEDGNTLTNVLNATENFWYAYNEGVGISTAKDNVDRRSTVTDNVLDDSDNIMTLLNHIRDKKNIDKDKLNSIIEATKMYADTETMTLTVEKTDVFEEDGKQKHKEREQFGEYLISNMNFGIAEVPVTTIDLQKEIQGFTITDATGQNILAKAERDSNGNLVGDFVLSTDGYYSAIEDEKLQGSRLEITYAIKSNMYIQLNYDNSGGVKATITELVDIIDNNLSYNVSLGNNSTYWEVIPPITSSSLDNISNYSTMVKTTEVANAKLNAGEEIQITLEKVLASTNATIEEIITSTVDVYKYNNTVEITKLDYTNVTPTGSTQEETATPQEDRIRTIDKYIIIPGKQYDIASAQILTITPPTGNGSMDITYYVIAVISLMILVVGVFVIKKFVVNTKK